MLTPHDHEVLARRGVTESQLLEQVDRFKSGFPFLRIADSARLGAGITSLSLQEEEEAITRWNSYLADGGRVAKFVPASGAASRMFKSLFAFVDGDADTPADGSDVARLLADVERLPFYKELDALLLKTKGKSVRQLLDEGRFKDVVAAIILPEGLNYGNLPKGLLSFHAYPDGSVRTPVEEQLVEGAQSATGKDGVVKLHFTVSGNHRALFEKKLSEAIPAIEKRMGVKFDVSMSEQKPSTDTVAVNPDNTLFRENGELVFRPGGHGALIQNLNDIDSEVIFIKNIDNVVPDSRRDSTIYYKKVLAGYLIELHDRIFKYYAYLHSGDYDRKILDEIVDFAQSKLSIQLPDYIKGKSDAELAGFLASKFNRPLRVAGMVRNEGEPGGGPYLTYNSDGSVSPQVLESTQIDNSNPEYVRMVSRATHFNPVDLVCYVTDFEGRHYDLPRYVDPSTGFISEKSLHGKTLRALELPGLWNGAMSDWTTVFVEVPISTFNPVKTVNDLLRDAHQSEK
ncbi:MAG: DUF4301 family protein [Muribaculaceae bacterium]|nr:DUF4301 family protein [Muribaculaceae bacterium]